MPNEEFSTTATRERSFMRQIAALLSADTTLEQIFEHLCEALADVVDASVVFIALRHADGAVRLEYMHDHGVMRRMLRMEMPVGSSTDEVMRTGATIVKRGSSDWPDRLQFSIPTQEQPSHDSVSAVYAPMKYGDATLGVLSVQSTREGAYSDDDARLIEAVAQYVAITVKGRWVSSVQRPAQRLPFAMIAILCVLLMASAAIVVFGAVREAALRDAALRAQIARAEAVTAKVESAVLEARQIVRSAATILGPLRGDRRTAESLLLRLLDSAPNTSIYGIGLWFEPYTFDPKARYFGPYVHQSNRVPGHLVLTHEWDTEKYSYPRHAWYQLGRTTKEKPAFTEPYFDTSLVFMSVVQPISDFRGKFAGVATVDMVQPQLRHFVPMSTSEPGEFVYITTSTGVPFIVPDEARFLQVARAAGYRARTILDVPPAILRDYIARTYPRPRTEQTVPIEYVRWRVHLSSDDRVLFAPITTFRRGLTVIGVAMWAIGILALFTLRQRRLHLGRTMRLEIEKVELEHEIAERQRVEEELRRFAYTDALTGLPNRAHVVDSLHRAIERRKLNGEFWFGVFFLDLDRFNVVNDSLGHAVGDGLLIEVGRRLRAALHLNHVVARIGGDEFLVLARYLGESADPAAFAQLIHNLFNEPFTVEGHEIFISASIGIAPCDTMYDAPEDLLRDADIAMHRAKGDSGRRFAVFDREMHADAVARHRLETELRKAVERSEFVLVYQPVLSLATRSPVGFEALIRWRHPERGILAPSEFIEVAEQTRLIIPIGKWILSEACLQAAAWHEGGLRGWWVSVNISAAQYSQPDLVGDVVAALDLSGIPPTSLKLEITESAIMSDAAATARTLMEFRRIGVRTQIDDFGTGYSSLSYLQQFPIDTLKIDQTFVGRMTEDADSYEIVRAIVTLAKSLRLEITAEGIEREQHVEALTALGVDYGHGYLFSRPLEARAIMDFVASCAL